MCSWMCQELGIEEKEKNREVVILTEDLSCARCIHKVVFINLFTLIEKGFIFLYKSSGNKAKKTSLLSVKVIFTHHSSTLNYFLEFQLDVNFSGENGVLGLTLNLPQEVVLMSCVMNEKQNIRGTYTTKNIPENRNNMKRDRVKSTMNFIDW